MPCQIYELNLNRRKVKVKTITESKLEGKAVYKTSSLKE